MKTTVFLLLALVAFTTSIEGQTKDTPKVSDGWAGEGQIKVPSGAVTVGQVAIGQVGTSETGNYCDQVYGAAYSAAREMVMFSSDHEDVKRYADAATAFGSISWRSDKEVSSIACSDNMLARIAAVTRTMQDEIERRRIIALDQERRDTINKLEQAVSSLEK